MTFHDSIEDLARNVDAIMILSVDGRPHLDEARRVFPFHKPVFIDKPLGGTLRDGIEICRLAPAAGRALLQRVLGALHRRHGRELEHAKVGRLMGLFVYGPARLEPHHPDLFWYGIHEVEKCYALMGTGWARRSSGPTRQDTDVITGVWPGGRIATIRGNRKHEE